MTWETSLESFVMRYNNYNKSYVDFLKSSQPSIWYRGFLDAIARVKVTQNCDLHVFLLADCPQLKVKMMEFKIPFQAQISFFPRFVADSFCHLLSVATGVKESFSLIRIFHSWLYLSSFILAILKVITE